MTRKTNLLVRAAMVLLLAVLCSAGAWAQEEAKAIIVWLSNGDRTSVLFDDLPEFTYADGYVTLQAATPSTAISWPLKEVMKLTFEDISTGVRDVRATGLDIVSDKMDVYDLNGRLVKQQVRSLSELPPGVYIVKDGNVTLKVVRK